ncbi:hypothetical protein Lal_00042741 [Lupinus albus]|nr:hypothetical protein Lal_00042741 [Lupinus albus]
MTCNPNWQEIVRILKPMGLKPHDRPCKFATSLQPKLATSLQSKLATSLEPNLATSLEPKFATSLEPKLATLIEQKSLTNHGRLKTTFLFIDIPSIHKQ